MQNNSLQQDNFNIRDAYQDLTILLKTTLTDICNGIITRNISIQKHNKNNPVTVKDTNTLISQLDDIKDLEITENSHINNIATFKKISETITICPIKNRNFSVIYADNKDKKKPFCLYEAYAEINKLVWYILSDFIEEINESTPNIKILCNSKKILSEAEIYDMKEYLDLTLYSDFDDEEDLIFIDHKRRHNMGLTFLKEIICAVFGNNSSLCIKGEM